MPLILPRDEYNLVRKLAQQLGGVLADLNSMMAGAKASDGRAVYELCETRPSGDRAMMEGTGCDRVKDHLGKHTWELGDEIARLNTGAQPKARTEVLTEGEVTQLRNWLGRASSSYYLNADSSIIFEAAPNGRLRVRVR